MFQLIQAILPQVRPGDEVILTNTDHEANIGAWLRLQAAGATVRFWNVNPQTLELDLADLEQLLSPRTTWVAMTHASNVLGTVNPVAEVAQRVHRVGARLCVDAVAYAPHRLVDVQASGADVWGPASTSVASWPRPSASPAPPPPQPQVRAPASSSAARDLVARPVFIWPPGPPARRRCLP
jgi:cysteine sulfinate desulfinase/cysteine desulfurase-like protein